MNEDLISRQAAIDIWCYPCSRNMLGHKCTECGAVQEMMALPSAERHGRWKDYSDDGYYECSVCGEAWTFIDGTPKDNNANYCPRCGAKMDEVENE